VERLPCRLQPRRAEVRGAERVKSRLPGGNEGEVLTLRLRLRLTVVSDYLFIGSGREALLGLNEALRRMRGVRIDTGSPERVLESLKGLVRGLRPVKDFYRARSPLSGRLQPAVPGSSLKGAARARIELASSGDEVVADFLYPGGTVGIVTRLPPRGRHGWRHVRIWCESVAERREKRSVPSVLEDLFGLASGELSLQSRVLFNTLYPVDKGLDCEPVELVEARGVERVCAVPRGAVFEGEVGLVNASFEELGLVLYGLGQDKLLCGKRPLILLGRSKYRCRRLRSGRRVSFGIVEARVVGFTVAPWSMAEWEGELRRARVRPGDVEGVVRAAVGAALAKYPGLRRCFDEVERRRRLEPCGSSAGR